MLGQKSQFCTKTPPDIRVSRQIPKSQIFVLLNNLRRGYYKTIWASNLTLVKWFVWCNYLPIQTVGEHPFVKHSTQSEATLYTDEYDSCNRLQRVSQIVCHAKNEWAQCQWRWCPSVHPQRKWDKSGSLLRDSCLRACSSPNCLQSGSNKWNW